MYLSRCSLLEVFCAQEEQSDSSIKCLVFTHVSFVLPTTKSCFPVPVYGRFPWLRDCLMTNVKCFRCGVVNLASNEVCKVCGIELLPDFMAGPVTYAEPAPKWQWDEPKPAPASLPGIRYFDGASDVVGPTFSLFKKNFWLITKLVVVIVTPFEAFRVLKMGEIADHWELTVAIFAGQHFCNFLIAPALIYALMKVMQTGKAPGINESYRWALGKIGNLTLCALVAWIVQLFGFALFIIPGIILTLAFEVVYPVAILENRSPIKAIMRSSTLTKGYKLKILGAVILLSLMMSVVTIPTSVATSLLLGGPSLDFWPLHIVLTVFTDIIGQATTVLSLVIYLSILRTLGRARPVIQ